jgi:hypothetical protein
MSYQITTLRYLFVPIRASHIHAVGYEVYHHILCLLISLHNTEWNFKFLKELSILMQSFRLSRQG